MYTDVDNKVCNKVPLGAGVVVGVVGMQASLDFIKERIKIRTNILAGRAGRTNEETQERGQTTCFALVRVFFSLFPLSVD